MPTLRINGNDLFFEETGQGDQTVVFSHGLLMDSRQWRAQVDHLADRYRCICYDHRGQGKSQVPSAPLIDMEVLYDDAASLIEALDAGPCHFVGLSMGGFVGLRLAARRPQLLRSLSLLNTAAGPEPAHNVPEYRKLLWVARLLGTGPVADKIMPIMFGDSFLDDPTRQDEVARWREHMSGLGRSIYKAVNGVIYRAGVEHEASRIDLPTLIIRGGEDRAIGRSKAEQLHRLVADSKLVAIDACGHTSSVEAPEQVNAAIEEFLTGL